MIGIMWKVGEVKSRPGQYIRWENVGGAAPIPTNLGVNATLTQLNWGPVGKPFRVERSQMENLKTVVGGGTIGADAIYESFVGGSSYIEVVRVGNGGELAKATLDDGEGGSTEFATLYPTDREFQILTRESLDGKKVEFIIAEDGRRLETHEIDTEKEEDAATQLTEMLKKSKYIQIVGELSGEVPKGITADFAGGSNPTATAEDYTTMFEEINKRFWDGLFLDTTDEAIKAAANVFLRRRLEEGGRSFLFLAVDDIDASMEEKMNEAKSYNQFTTVLVGNGAKVAGRDLTGPLIAARIAGMSTSSSYKTGLTAKVIAGSVEVIGEPTNSEYTDAVNNGLMMLSYNADGMVQIDSGINTLVSLGEDEDAGWKKVRRVKIRYYLIEQILRRQEVIMRAGVDNTQDTRDFLCQTGNSVIEQMKREGSLEKGRMIEDPNRPAQGDSAWFIFEDIGDVDQLEKAYNTAEFQY